MSLWLIILIAILITSAFVLAAVVFHLPIPWVHSPQATQVQNQLKNVVAAQRETETVKNQIANKRAKTLLQSLDNQQRSKGPTDSGLNLRKKLRFARWTRVSVVLYRIIEIFISLFAFAVASRFFGIPLQLLSLFTGPVLLGAILNFAVDRRSAAFDRDYPQFLLSLVGLLKTGMNPLQAIEASTQGLEESALLRQECEMMLERLRLGVTEERSIGSFGEDIYHPEIELFVQALILSRRVGGTLSDTLERLARQVRRRQYFKKMAISSVGMQRGSIWFIVAVLCGMLGFIRLKFPAMIQSAVSDSGSWTIIQGAIVVIIIGIWWVRQITKIKI